MHGTTAIVRFRGTLGPQRLAVVEFPPSLRTVLVFGDMQAFPFRCQLPYQIFVIFYDRSADGISLDATPWVGGNAVCFSRVCLFFRNSPMTSIDSPLYLTPFPNQLLPQGAFCLGSDTRMKERLYAKHPTLRDLVQTVTDSFWGSSFHSNKLYRRFSKKSLRIDTFTGWARESKNPDFLGTVNWELLRRLRVRDLDPGMSLEGRFNPGRRPT